jgi:hypothetical protein
MVLLYVFALILHKISTMKNLFATVIFVILTMGSFAQRIAKVTMSNTGVTEMISIGLDENAVVNISQDGNIINYGVEYFSERVSNYSRLEQYNGRVDLYAATDDKFAQGKLKYIGRTAVTYYAAYEDESLRGKIKTIGSLIFNYYMPFDEEYAKGKIKSIGTSSLTYYSAFENDGLRGKIKSIASTNLTYYSSFDDKAFKGKIKSIGSVSFTYYGSFDRQFAGAMKTGSQQQNVNGINFMVR